MWIAIYDDGEERLGQFDEDGSENLFSQIDQERLSKFIVRTHTQEIILNLQNGEFKVNGVKLSFGYEHDLHRLIYFRRVRQTLGVSSGPSIVECVGWQTTIQGSQAPLNKKFIVGLEEDKITIQCE